MKIGDSHMSTTVTMVSSTTRFNAKAHSSKANAVQVKRMRELAQENFPEYAFTPRQCFVYPGNAKPGSIRAKLEPVGVKLSAFREAISIDLNRYFRPVTSTAFFLDSNIADPKATIRQQETAPSKNGWQLLSKQVGEHEVLVLMSKYFPAL
jgi:hypothetical protein